MDIAQVGPGLRGLAIFISRDKGVSKIMVASERTSEALSRGQTPFFPCNEIFFLFGADTYPTIHKYMRNR